MKNGEGCWFADDDLLAELEANSQIALRYAAGANPNGAVADVAGVVNAGGNVFGLMPHPEHAVDPLLGSTDGALILGSLVDAAAARSLAAVGLGDPRSPREAPSRAAQRGHPRASSFCSRSTSRARSVTGPRRPTPSVE